MILKKLCLSLVIITNCYAHAYTIDYNGEKLTVHQTSKKAGKLSNGTKVALSCIPKGRLARIDVDSPDYRGSFTNKAGERCHVFAQESL